MKVFLPSDTVTISMSGLELLLDLLLDRPIGEIDEDWFKDKAIDISDREGNGGQQHAGDKVKDIIINLEEYSLRQLLAKAEE